MGVTNILAKGSVVKLSQHYASRRVYVPKCESPGARRLRRLLGDAEFDLLRSHFGGSAVSIPTLRGRGKKLAPSHSRAELAERNAQIVALSKEQTRRAIAERFGLTESRIYGILKSVS